MQILLNQRTRKISIIGTSRLAKHLKLTSSNAEAKTKRQGKNFMNEKTQETPDNRGTEVEAEADHTKKEEDVHQAAIKVADTLWMN